MKKGITFPRVHDRVCGIDVHKNTIVMTIEGEGIERETREYNTFTDSLMDSGEWLQSNEITVAAMESTGIFWIPIYNILEDYVPTLILGNARNMRNVPGHKTDRMDSAWICKLAACDLVAPSFVPSRGQREVRDWTRYRLKLIRTIASFKNRVAKHLETCNIKLKSVVNDVFGVTGTKIIDRIREGEPVTLEFIKEIRRGNMKASAEDIFRACTGRVGEHDREVLNELLSVIRFLEGKVEHVSGVIARLMAPHEATIERLMAIPGFSRRSVENLLAETGLDMSRFGSMKKFACWAGHAPGNNESAGKKKSARTTQGNQYVKDLMVEVAWAATRCKKSFYCERYHRLAARRGKKRALVAIAHSLLRVAYSMLSTGETYRELGVDYYARKRDVARLAHLRNEVRKIEERMGLRDVAPQAAEPA